MSDKYNILAQYITKRYVDRISGNDIDEKIIGDDPAERVMVGMLAEDRVEMSLSDKYIENSSTRFESVPSISISFIVKKNLSGYLRIIPSGLLFYCVQPIYHETVDYILQKYSEKDKVKYQSIEELTELYPDEKFSFPLTYKAIRLESVLSDGIIFSLDELKQESFHLEKQINEALVKLSENVMSEIVVVQKSHIKFSDLLSQNRFDTVTSIKDVLVCPQWKLDIFCTVVEHDDSWRISLQLVNKTPARKGDSRNLGYIPRFFNVGLRVIGNEHVEFSEIQLGSFKDNFKATPNVYVVSENTSARYIKENNEIITENVPCHYQYRLKTNDQYNSYITFDELITNPLGNLQVIHQAMVDDYQKCNDEYNSCVSSLSIQANRKFRNALDEYEREIKRFEVGIKQIERRDFVKKAFRCMNETFKMDLGNKQRPLKGWRLFQIVFIVSLLPKVIRSEYRSDNTLQEADLETANLLYFPTGGGKTEAFLGITVFTMFFDRLRGKDDGISAFIKYPLRLLAVQQLERVLTIVMKANIVRSLTPELQDSNEFKVGFYVGKVNTPNKISPTEVLSARGQRKKTRNRILESDPDTLNEYYRFIDTCPICGEKHVNIVFNREKWTLEHRCDNPNCSIEVLPLLIVDNEIYRYLPSVVVSTIDKMALLGTTNEFKMLFGQVKSKCSVHGFSATSKCLAPQCNSHGIKPVGLLKDPVPTLFIQDELHLVKESLGTFDAHYESFISNYARNLVPVPQRKQIWFVGATATISMYEEHIKNLYHMEPCRFPCEYPSMNVGTDFYSYTDPNDITRIIIGYAPYGRSVTDGVWESVYLMRLIIDELFTSETAYQDICKFGFSESKEEFQNMLYDYWIELVYNNRKQDAIELENAFQNQGNNLLEEKGIPKFNIEQMTSDTDFQTVRKTLFDIQANRKNRDATNLLLATSTISHGVDEDSFNIMYFFGVPNNNAEYIQAYSRTGRKYTGIVVDIMRLLRTRDRSYLKNFNIFHENKDNLVESVPINRWAKNAIYSTLPGILAGMIHQYYTIQSNVDSLYQALDVKRLLMNGTINIDNVVHNVIQAYECSDGEKLSIAYRDIIEEEVTKILEGICNGTLQPKENLSSAIGRFSHGGLMPMTSLRDTEKQIEIKVGD